MVAKRWHIPDLDADRLQDLRRHVSCTETLASILLRRGIDDVDDAARFLDPKLLDLVEPSTLPDIDLAVDRIGRAIAERERVAIFGDYDVDGLASTCLLRDFFQLLDFPVRCRLPHRLREGYGLRDETVRDFAVEGTDLLITVDNGSSARAPIELARSLGIDVVVIDHHQPSDLPPEPVALVNPWLSKDERAFRELAGVGVTFKVVWALSQHFSRAKKLSPRFRQFLLDSLALVALGTVADVVPLRGENRVLTKFGLVALRDTSRPGLRKLVELCLPATGPGSGGPSNGRTVARTNGGANRRRPSLEARDIGFRIGPRLNAAGRLGQAEIAMRLLTTESETEADELLGVLEADNEHRRAIEAAILATARTRILADVDLSVARCLVLGDADWHPGVLGIVAARLVDEFYRPTLLFAIDGDRARGSARSIPHVHLHDAMSRCAEHFVQFGGHAFAAGAEIDPARIDSLRVALHDAIDVAPHDMVPTVEVDCRLPLDAIDATLLAELARLSPHGAGNPVPLFVASDVEIVGQPRVIGRDGQHLTFHVREPGGHAAFRAVAFGLGARVRDIARRGTRVSLLFEVRWNEWQGQRAIELRVLELELSGLRSR